MAGADWEAHNRQGDDALEWENEQIGTFPDVEVAQTAALVIAGKDPQLEAAVAGEHHLLQSTLIAGLLVHTDGFVLQWRWRSSRRTRRRRRMRRSRRCPTARGCEAWACTFNKTQM